MKKQLLFVLAFVASSLSLSAQTYAIPADATITSSTEITSVEGVKLTFAEDTYTVKGGTQVEGYVAYVSGAGNPVDVNNTGFDKGGDVPTIGSVFNLSVSKDGEMSIAVVLNANKNFYILEDGVALTNYNGIKVADKYYGTYEFDVKAGKTYTTFCTGSKLGFYGFTFTAGGDTGITDSTINKEVVSTEYYNIVGVRTNEPTKGLNMVKSTMSDGSVSVEKVYIP